jgi:hypothetical protein
VGLRSEVALWRLHARLGILAPAVVAVVSPQSGVLRALLVHEHHVDDDARAVGPGEGRRDAAVADEVTFAHPVRNHRGATIGSATVLLPFSPGPP